MSKLGIKESKVKVPRSPIPDEKVKPPKTHAPVRIVYVWSLVFLGMVLYTFTWFTMGTLVMTVIDAITASFHFAAPWDTIVESIRNCFLIHPIIALIGWFIYGILNSAKRDVDTWRV